jgi:hypothetical protein
MTNIIEMPQPQALVAMDNSPGALLALAVQRGDDMERLKQLMDLQDRWEASEALKAYNRAFAAFKAEAIVLVRNKKVTAGPLQGKSYAELHAVVNTITEALSRHGLSAAWNITKDERDWLEVTCTLKHSGGHSESVSMGGPPDTGGAKNKIQERASTVSYLERYTLKAITGLAEQDDDNDGGHKDSTDPSNVPKYLGLKSAVKAKSIRQSAGAALALFNVGDELGMYGEVAHITDQDERLALWRALGDHSDCKAAIKRMAEEERAAQAKLDAERAGLS